MSDPHDAYEPNHEGPIKTPKQLIATVAASLLITIAAIVALANYVDFGVRPGAGSELLSAEAVTRRIQPIGSVEIRDAANPGIVRAGEQVYTGQCAACHGAGVAGAPKLGDAAGWAQRIATGYEALLNSALKGKGAMGPQSGGEYTDLEIGRAVVYMTNQSGGSFQEPQAPAVAASAAAGTSDAATAAVDVVAPVAGAGPGGSPGAPAGSGSAAAAGVAPGAGGSSGTGGAAGGTAAVPPVANQAAPGSAPR